MRKDEGGTATMPKVDVLKGLTGLVSTTTCPKCAEVLVLGESELPAVLPDAYRMVCENGTHILIPLTITSVACPDCGRRTVAGVDKDGLWNGGCDFCGNYITQEKVAVQLAAERAASAP